MRRRARNPPHGGHTSPAIRSSASRRFASARAGDLRLVAIRKTKRLPFDIEHSRERGRDAHAELLAVRPGGRARLDTLVMRPSRASARAAEVFHDALAPASHEDRAVLEERGGGRALRAPRDLLSPDGELPARHRGKARSRGPFGPGISRPRETPASTPSDRSAAEIAAEILRYASPAPASNSAEPAGATTQYVSSPSWRSALPPVIRRTQSSPSARTRATSRIGRVLVAADRDRRRVERIEPQDRRASLPLGPFEKELVQGHVLGAGRAPAIEEQPSFHLIRDPRGSRGRDTAPPPPRRDASPAW